MVAFNLVRASALAALLVSGPALAQSSSDPISNVLRMMGITASEQDPIEYRERAPLVVPPTTSRLRTPEEAAAERNPKWPQDPDIAARKRKNEEAKAPLVKDRRYDPNTGTEVPLETGQVRNRYAGVPTSGNDQIPTGASDRIPSLTPDQLQKIMASGQNQTPVKPGTEPTRQYLTEPPNGYRRAAAGAPVKATMDPIINSDQVEMNILRKQQ